VREKGRGKGGVLITLSLSFTTFLWGKGKESVADLGVLAVY